VICFSGGSCVTTDDDNYSCICRAGFAGDNCELNINDCDVNPCFNSGTCIDEVNSFRCLCVPGFVGDLCQENVDDCLTKPCANGGTCLDLVNDYKCTCAAGYVGKDCSINIDECEPNPCLNGGICEDRVEEYFCKCPTGYRGQRCEINDITSIYDAPQPIFNIFDNSTDLPISVLSSEKAESLTPQQLIVIVIVSSSVPFMVIIATISIIVCKHRKNRLQTIKRKDEDEACRQNEQNLVTSMNNKCVDLHPAANVIVNALDRPPSLNHLNRGKSATLSKLTNEKYDSQLIYARQMAANEKAATLQKTKSNNKLLNTECGVNNNSRPVSKLITDHDNYDNNYDNNMSNIALMPNKDCIASHINTINTIERRGSLPHPHSVPNPLAKR
jgi:Golgi apparatus protein 1